MAKSVEWRRREFVRCLRRWVGDFGRGLSYDSMVAHISYCPILKGDSLAVAVLNAVNFSLVASIMFPYLENERPETAFFLLVEILKAENITDFLYEFEPSYTGYAFVCQYSPDGTAYALQ
jgi:hypothetical protein